MTLDPLRADVQISSRGAFHCMSTQLLISSAYGDERVKQFFPSPLSSGVPHRRGPGFDDICPSGCACERFLSNQKLKVGEVYLAALTNVVDHHCDITLGNSRCCNPLGNSHCCITPGEHEDTMHTSKSVGQHCSCSSCHFSQLNSKMLHT